jgi:hypothetical protein
MRLSILALSLLTPVLAAQTASYTTFGSGCGGSDCFVQNDDLTQTGTTHNTNIFALPITPSKTSVITGFKLFNKVATGTTPVIINTQIYLADSAGKPDNSTVVSSKMAVTAKQGWHSTTFAKPIIVKANQTFFISHTGGNQVTWSWKSGGTKGIHYWHSPTTTAWNGPFTSVTWAYRVTCAGGGTPPVLSATNTPKLGSSNFSVDLSGAKATTAAGLILGISKTSWGPITLPLSLAGAGAPGCSLLVSFDQMFVLATDASGKASFSFKIPNDKAFNGATFHDQWFALDTTANSLGLVWSNGGTGVIGS